MVAQQTKSGEAEALALIARAMGLVPASPSDGQGHYDELVAWALRRFAQAEEVVAAERAVADAGRRQLQAQVWLGHARRALAVVVECPGCPVCAEIAADALDRTAIAPVPPREEPERWALPPAQGEPAELFARLERIGGFLIRDLSAERRAAVYEIKAPLIARHSGSVLNISLSALRHALPMWEQLSHEAAAGLLDPEGATGQLSAADLMLWAAHLAEDAARSGVSGDRHTLPLLTVLQRAVRELELSPEEFAAVAFEGRRLQQRVLSVAPSMKPGIMARWGTQVDRVWPAPAYEEDV